MDESLKQLLTVVIVVIVAVALIAFIGGDGFLSSITDKISSAIEQISWGS